MRWWSREQDFSGFNSRLREEATARGQRARSGRASFNSRLREEATRARFCRLAQLPRFNSRLREEATLRLRRILNETQVFQLTPP